MKKHSKSLLEQLYDGEFFPCETVVPRDPEYRPACQRAGQERTYLSERLSADDRQHLDQLLQLRTEIENMTAYANFLDGFRSGMLLMHELLTTGEP